MYFLIPYGAVLPIAAVSFLTFWPGEDHDSATGKYVTAIPVVLALLFLTLYKPHLKMREAAREEWNRLLRSGVRVHARA